MTGSLSTRRLSTRALLAGTLATVILALAPPDEAGAAVSVGASLDRRTARVGEQLVLTVNIEGEARRVGEPQLPDLPDFDVYGGGQSQRMSFVNGVVSASYAYTYYLRPRRMGEFEIPPIQVQVDDSLYQTHEIPVEILAADQPLPRPQRPEPSAPVDPGGGDDYFVSMRVDADTVVIGEQVILDFGFYRAAHASLFDSPEYTPPTTEGFWRENLPPERHSTSVLNGRLYNVTEIRYALFPTRSGQLEIGEAVVRIPGDTFPSFLRRRRRQEDTFLRAPAIPVFVRPLPPGAPAGFDGTVAAGLAFRAETDRDRLAAGEALTLSIVLEGDGYLAAAKRPDVNEIPGFRVHDDGSAVDSRPLGGRVHGRLEVDKLLIAQEEGEFVIPGLRYVYYDTVRDEYVTLVTQPIPVEVLPSDAEVTSVFRGAGRSEIELLGQDVLHIHPITGSMRPYGGPLPLRPVFWTLLAAPGLVWAASGALARRRRRLLADPTRLRASRALREARRRLRSDMPPEVRVAEAVRGFLADKTGRMAAGLTASDIERWMRDAAVPPRLAAQVLNLLERCDRARFAGELAESQAAVTEAETLLESLEKELGRAG